MPTMLSNFKDTHKD